MRVKFACLNRQGIAIHQIPGVALQFSTDISNESRRTVQTERLPSAECNSKHPVKSNEVIHMRMRDEQIAGAKQAGRAQGLVLPQIEQQGPARPFDVDVETRIAEGVIDEIAGKRGRQAYGGE
jgi:hypothetical protein